MKKYTDQHEWLVLQNDIAMVGISDYAQHQLGDVVYVDLPAIGSQLKKGQEAAVVESVKAASEVYSPITGEVVEINEVLRNQPDLINTSAETEGWFFKIKPSNENELEELMDESSYTNLISG